MKLTRVVHTESRVVHGAAAELLPDVATVGADATAPADACLLFIDADGSEVHAYIFPGGSLRELADRIIAATADAPPSLEVVRTFPGELLTPKGGTIT